MVVMLVKIMHHDFLIHKTVTEATKTASLTSDAVGEWQKGELLLNKGWQNLDSRLMALERGTNDSILWTNVIVSPNTWTNDWNMAKAAISQDKVFFHLDGEHTSNNVLILYYNKMGRYFTVPQLRKLVEDANNKL